MIYGKQIALRPMESEDQDFIHALNEDPVVRGRVVGWDWPSSAHHQKAWFSASTGGGSTHRWVVLGPDGEPIGLTGLWDVDWHNRNALSALKLGGVADVRGKGLGSDAIMTVMAFAFCDVGLHRLHTTILADNTASERAYVRKCGWTVEGVSREHVWRHGRYVDLLHVGILKSDFDALPDSSDHVDLIVNGR